MKGNARQSPADVFLSPLGSIPFLLRRPKLLGLAVMPVLINICLFVLLTGLGYQLFAVPLSDRIDFGGESVTSVLVFLSRVLLTVALILISAFFSFLLIIPVSAPFCDLISEKVEREYLREAPELLAPSQTIWDGIKHSLKDALERVVFVLPVLVVIFLIGWIPVFGPPVAAILGFIHATIFLSLDAYSYSMDRRGIRFRQKWRFLSERKGIWLPLGMGLSLFLLLPCNVVFVPMLASVAATRQYCRTILKDRGEKPRLSADH